MEYQTKLALKNKLKKYLFKMQNGGDNNYYRHKLKYYKNIYTKQYGGDEPELSDEELDELEKLVSNINSSLTTLKTISGDAIRISQTELEKTLVELNNEKTKLQQLNKTNSDLTNQLTKVNLKYKKVEDTLKELSKQLNLEKESMMAQIANKKNVNHNTENVIALESKSDLTASAPTPAPLNIPDNPTQLVDTSDVPPPPPEFKDNAIESDNSHVQSGGVNPDQRHVPLSRVPTGPATPGPQLGAPTKFKFNRSSPMPPVPSGPATPVDKFDPHKRLPTNRTASALNTNLQQLPDQRMANSHIFKAIK